MTLAKKLSRQREAQLRQIARGLCAQFCGRPAQVGRQQCRECQIKGSIRKRLALGCKAWVPGGPGRPPLESR